MTENATPVTLIGPTLAEMQIARGTVAAVAQITPVETSRFLSDLLGSPVLLKCENLQRTGSYKIRGAFNRLSALSAEERTHGVVAVEGELARRALLGGAVRVVRAGSPAPRRARQPSSGAPPG